MPHYSPLMWTILLLMTASSVMMIVTNLFFTQQNKSKYSKKAPKPQNVNWKW